VTKRNKTIALIFFGITLIGLIVLATGISRLEFQSGERFSLPRVEERDTRGTPDANWVDVLLTITRIFLGLSVLLMPAYILYLFFSRRARRDLAGLLTRIAVLAALLLLVSRLPMTGIFDEEFLFENGGGGGNSDFEPAPLAEFVANPPDWAINLVGIILALAITGILGIVLINRKRKPVKADPFERLAEEAEEAIQDLYAGKDLRKTIIRCYRDMSLVLDQERSIRRNSAMTTHEFEAMLQEMGLPGEPIHELTRLFEDVRYGNLPAGEADETRAISSLTAIVSTIRSEE
jgi:hypothetical protein